MQWDDLLRYWLKAFGDYLEEDEATCRISGPSSVDELQRAEKELERRLPNPLQDFLLHESGFIHYWWDLDTPRARKLPAAFPTSGYFEFNLPTMINMNFGRRIPGYGKDPKTYQERWEKAFAFAPVPNGDAIALDVLTDPKNPPVIYLDHARPDDYIRLGESFDSFIDCWFELACVGPEIWHLSKFMTEQGKPLEEYSTGSPNTVLDPDGEFALSFLSAFAMS